MVRNFVVELDSFSLTESQLVVECCRSADDDEDVMMVVQQKTAVNVADDSCLIAKCHLGCNYYCW